MKKIISIVLFFILCFGCTKENKSSINYQKHNIKFLNWNLNIPENYILVSLEEYKNIIRANSLDSISISNKISKTEVLNNSIKGEYAFFCDKYNIDNTLIIIQMFNQIPNNYLKNDIAKQIHSDIRKKQKTESYIYKPIENKLINNWLIKIKGEKEYTETGKSIFNTVYYSHKFGAVIISDNKSLDFEKEFTE